MDIIVVRRLQELGRKEGVALYTCFVDLQRAYDSWSAFCRYANFVYNRPTTTISMALKVRMLQAEVREALLYGCRTCTLLTREYGLLRTQHHRLLLRCEPSGKANAPTTRYRTRQLCPCPDVRVWKRPFADADSCLRVPFSANNSTCLLYTSDAADE